MNNSSIYDEIRQSVNSGNIASLPKETLEQYSIALARAQAYTHFGTSEFPRVCETVKTFLAYRLSDHVAGKYSGKPDNEQKQLHNREGISLYKIAEGVIKALLVLFIVWILFYYFGIHL